MTLDEYTAKVAQLKRLIGDFLDKSGYLEDGEITKVRYNPMDREEEYAINIGNTVSRLLVSVYKNLDYTTLPVRAFGTVLGNESSGYHVGDYYLSSGDSCELLVSEYNPYLDSEFKVWRPTQIEYDSRKKDYYFWGYSDTPVKGAYIRVKY